MTRLTSLARLDVRLQHRHGFYYAAAFITLVWIVLLRQLPTEALPVAVPVIIFTDLSMVGYYFLAGTVFMEKEQRTLAALVVSPMRFGDYLAAKLATLTALAVVISLVITVATYGFGFNALLLTVGTVLAALMLLLVGFISAAPFDSISTYLMPSQLYLLPLALPLIDYFGWWQSPLFSLIPTQGSLLLLRGAFEPIAAGQVLYAVAYQVLWIGGLAWMARRAFRRHMVAKMGGS